MAKVEFSSEDTIMVLLLAFVLWGGSFFRQWMFLALTLGWFLYWLDKRFKVGFGAVAGKLKSRQAIFNVAGVASLLLVFILHDSLGYTLMVATILWGLLALNME